MKTSVRVLLALLAVGMLEAIVSNLSRSAAAPAFALFFQMETWLSLMFLLLAAGLVLREAHRTGRLAIAAGIFLTSAFAIAVGLSVPLHAAAANPYHIEVFKQQRRLRLIQDGAIRCEFPIALGSGGASGDKLAEGDMRTPEGDFFITNKDTGAFHQWLGLSYPSNRHADRARLSGRITWLDWARIRFRNVNSMVPPQATVLGGAVGIHGGGCKRDWTLGCIALDNDAIDALAALVPPGTPVHIEP